MPGKQPGMGCFPVGYGSAGRSWIPEEHVSGYRHRLPVLRIPLLPVEATGTWCQESSFSRVRDEAGIGDLTCFSSFFFFLK